MFSSRDEKYLGIIFKTKQGALPQVVTRLFFMEKEEKIVTYYYQNKSKPLLQRSIFLKKDTDQSAKSRKTQTSLYMSYSYDTVIQLSVHVETVLLIWLPPRLSGISFILPKLICVINGFLPRLSADFVFLQDWQKAESHGQSLQEAIFRGR